MSSVETLAGTGDGARALAHLLKRFESGVELVLKRRGPRGRSFAKCAPAEAADVDPRVEDLGAGHAAKEHRRAAANGRIHR